MMNRQPENPTSYSSFTGTGIFKGNSSIMKSPTAAAREAHQTSPRGQTGLSSGRKDQPIRQKPARESKQKKRFEDEFSELGSNKPK